VRTVNNNLVRAITLVIVVAISSLTQAENFRVLHVFAGADGASPYAALIQDARGVLYGTTISGGAYGEGTVFAVDTSGNERVLHSFNNRTGEDGYSPFATLVKDGRGNLYGTTMFGGAHLGGTVFVVKIMGVEKLGEEKVLYSFAGGTDGANPQSSLIRDAAGSLYGTTLYGGAQTYGTVFVVDTKGEEKVLHSFDSAPFDGSTPIGGLVQAAAENFYGTTYTGGASGQGTVFVIDKTGKEQVLHSFSGTDQDGALPSAGLVEDEAGNLYGTTVDGGPHNDGTVFVITKSGEEKVLYSFTGVNGDGVAPTSGLLRDAAGNLYGTTLTGGAFGDGAVFVVKSTGQEMVLHSFSGDTDGANPQAGLIEDDAGHFYGTTSGGGFYGLGTVFELTP